MPTSRFKQCPNIHVNEKTNLKLILFQWIGIIFIIFGIQRFFYAFYAEDLTNWLNAKANEESVNNMHLMTSFLFNRVYYALATALFGIIIVALINWKRKNDFINTSFVFILVVLIFISRILFNILIIQYINYFEQLFTKNLKYSYLIGGIIFTIIGSVLLWKSNRIENRYNS